MKEKITTALVAWNGETYKEASEYFDKFKYDPEFLEYTEDLDRCRLQCVCSEEEKAFGD